MSVNHNLLLKNRVSVLRIEGLAVLVHGVRERLAGNFVGAYLQGSFAIGDANTGSDCDFIVAIEHDLTDGEMRELDRLHEAIHRLP